jgi:hypothetical protein
MASAGYVRGGADRYRVHVLREAEAWIVAIFYIDEESRTAYVTHVVSARAFREHRRAALMLGADRGLRHRIRKGT